MQILAIMQNDCAVFLQHLQNQNLKKPPNKIDSYFLCLLTFNFIHPLDDGVWEPREITRVSIHQEGLLLVMEAIHCPHASSPHLCRHGVTLLQSLAGGVTRRLALTVHMETVTPWTQLRIIIHTHGPRARSKVGGSWFWRSWWNGNKVFWTEHGAPSQAVACTMRFWRRFKLWTSRVQEELRRNGAGSRTACQWRGHAVASQCHFFHLKSLTEIVILPIHVVLVQCVAPALFDRVQTGSRERVAFQCVTSPDWLIRHQAIIS